MKNQDIITEKKHIANFMTEFKVLVIKTEIDDMHVIFLLKKNIRSNIIKTILGYLLVATLNTFKKQKVAIISVEWRYEFTERRYNYRIEIEITYRGKKATMEIRKFKDNYNKDRKHRYFNYNVYGHMTKDHRKLKK